MNARTRTATIAAAAITFAVLGISVSAPASAADCSYNKWGSNKWSGQRYDCPNGNGMYIKPPIGSNSNSAPKPWQSWQGTDDRGNGYDCYYSRFSRTWDCR